MAAHIKKTAWCDASDLGIRVLVARKFDILKDGSLDYSDELLAQFEVVVCSVHSHESGSRGHDGTHAGRIENPYTQISAIRPGGSPAARGVRL